MNQKVIFITGASSGIGDISAQMLAQKGHIVYGTSRKSVSSQYGVSMLELDVTRPETIQASVDRILKEQGRIDVVINNAGIGIGGAIELTTSQEVELQMNINFFGVVNVCRAILPIMRKARRGRIINVSSLSGVLGIPYQGFYAASKFALEGYSESLALEVYPFGIDVCLVEPGDCSTTFSDNRNISSATLNDPDYGEIFAKSLAKIEKEERNGIHPREVGKVMCRLIGCNRPPFRTKIGEWNQVTFARFKCFIPGKLMLYILRFYYGFSGFSPQKVNW